MPIDLETALAFAIAAVACLWGAVVDIRSRRIPNRITFPAMLLLLVVHGAFSGMAGFSEAALGLAGAGLVFLVPYSLGQLGGGDVKLMAAMGAALGSSAVLTLVLFTSIAGGLQFVAWMLWMHFSRSGSPPGYRLCYGPAIAIGSLGAMALHLAGKPYVVLNFSGF